VSHQLKGEPCAERCRELGRRRTRGQGHIVSDGGSAQGRLPRMKPEANPMPFDGKRMIYGGFEPIVER
jgi:hypothetical protein